MRKTIKTYPSELELNGWVCAFIGILSALAILFLPLAFSHDPEGRLFGAAFCGIFGCLAIPFWVAYRGRVPLMLAAGIGMFAIDGLIYLNCWACQKSGTMYVHPRDHLDLLSFCLPGLVAIGRSYIRTVSMWDNYPDPPSKYIQKEEAPVEKGED